MSELASKRLISGRSMKLVAGGVSLVVLAVLAVLTAGFLAGDSESESAARPDSRFCKPRRNRLRRRNQPCPPAVRPFTQP